MSVDAAKALRFKFLGADKADKICQYDLRFKRTAPIHNLIQMILGAKKYRRSSSFNGD